MKNSTGDVKSVSNTQVTFTARCNGDIEAF